MFFKQKTAYEMRISDWSSDVCSSDLEVTQNASAAAREVGTAPAQPQAVAPDQAESTDSTSSVGIGDIVVTAQRRAENVQQVPIAVAAFSGAALQEKGVDNVSQLANLTPGVQLRSEEHTSELQSLMRISYAVFCLKKKKQNTPTNKQHKPPTPPPPDNV